MAAIALGVVLGGSQSFFALNPSLDISRYGHTGWRIRDGFPTGTAFAIAQTPDGYLWLGTEFGLFPSDGVLFLQWNPPAGQHLPFNSTPFSLLVSRDGTLWIGTFEGLASWNGDKLTEYPDLDKRFVISLLEDRGGTVSAGTFGYPAGSATGRLCGIRGDRVRWIGTPQRGLIHVHQGRTDVLTETDGLPGNIIAGIFQDREGNIWVSTARAYAAVRKDYRSMQKFAGKA
jgi:ligand-binding sensor domain-containing protein